MFRITQITPPPASFTQAVSAGATFGELSANARNDIRDHLRSEQNNRCAYCERHLREDHKTVLEHFHPQNKTGAGSKQCEQRIGGSHLSRSDVEPGNLLLSCDGHKQHPGSDLTCDASKGGEDICEKFFNPKHQQSPTLVAVNRSGHISALHFPDAEEAAQEVLDCVLNLNDRHLCDARQRETDAWRRRWKEFREQDAKKGKKTPMAELRTRFATNLRRAALTNEFPSTLESIAVRIEAREAL